MAEMGISSLLKRLSDAARQVDTTPAENDAPESPAPPLPAVVRIRISDVEQARALARSQDNSKLWDDLNSQSISLSDVGRCVGLLYSSF